MPGSELKQLLDQIALSYEAAQRALTSPAIVAKHEFIQKRMEEIEIARDTVTKVVGDEFRATEIVVKTLDRIETRAALLRAESKQIERARGGMNK